MNAFCRGGFALIALFSLYSSAWADSQGPIKNPWQAYPPSCVAVPLPAQSGPIWTARVNLPTYNSILSGPVGVESVTFQFWRTPCSGGKSALIGWAIRDAALQNTFPQPLFAGIFVTQGAVVNHSVRLASDPNTFFTDIPTFPIGAGFSFVFENGPDYEVDYSQALGILINGLPQVAGVIPAYDPTLYSTASLPLQLSGYLTGNFYDTTHGGEGVQVEIGQGNGTDRYIVFAWYTYDPGMVPFWLFGLGGFSAGDRSATVTMVYATGGGFAGNFAGTTNHPWGTVTVQFPDCNTMQFAYQANGGLPSNVPQGTGSKTWTRLTAINGLACE